MKTQLILCTMVLFLSACNQATTTPSTTQPDQIPIVQRTSSPTSTTSPTNLPTASPSVPTTDSGSNTKEPCTPALTPAGFFPGGGRLLGFRENLVQIYNLKSHAFDIQFQMPGRVVIAALSSDGQMIAVGLEDFSIRLVRVSDQKVVTTLDAHQGTISGLAFSPASDQLLTASEDSWVRIWSLDGQELDAFKPSGADNLPNQVMGIGISSDWKRLATIPFDGRMNLWSLPDHTLLGSFEGSILGGYTGSQAAFSPDGQYLAQHLGAGGGSFSLWRIVDGKLLLRGENSTTGVDFSSDRRYLAYGEMLPTGGGHVVLRTQDGSQVFYELTGPTGSLPAIPRFTPDGNLLVAVDYVSGALLAWSTSDGKLLSFGEVDCPDR
jgi:WD40 repeat protein